VNRLQVRGSLLPELHIAPVASGSAVRGDSSEASADNCGSGRERDDCGEPCGGGGAVLAEGGDVVLRVCFGHVVQVVKGAFRDGLVAFAACTVEAIEMSSPRG
jgi:hypothetical protein